MVCGSTSTQLTLQIICRVRVVFNNVRAFKDKQRELIFGN